jgi:hypothetical protein
MGILVDNRFSVYRGSNDIFLHQWGGVPAERAARIGTKSPCFRLGPIWVSSQGCMLV